MHLHSIPVRNQNPLYSGSIPNLACKTMKAANKQNQLQTAADAKSQGKGANKIEQVKYLLCPETKKALNFHEVSKPNQWSYPKS